MSLYYYLKVLKYMYIEKSEIDNKIDLSPIAFVVLSILFIAMIFIGIYPSPLMDAIQHATYALTVVN